MWNDPALLLDMLQAAQKVLEYASGLDRPRFESSSRDQDAILRQLTILGEAAKGISGEFRSEHSDIPWRRIAGFRDVVVHQYFNVNLEEVWRIVREDVPSLIPLIEPLIPPKEP